MADRDARKPWEWKRPPGHEDQPLAEWWVEQVAVVIVLAIGKRARRRGDQQTLNRMLALAFAGRDAEVIAPPGASTSTRDIAQALAAVDVCLVLLSEWDDMDSDRADHLNRALRAALRPEGGNQ